MLKKVVVGSMLLVFVIAIGTTLAAKDVKDKKFTLPVLEKFLLSKSEMPGYRLKYQHKHHWFIGRKNGKSQQKIGVEQNWVSSSGISTYVSYCAFNSHQEALDAATFYKSNMASIFKEGSLTGLPVGDKSWIATQQSQGAAILVVQGNAIVLVGDSLCRENERKHLERIVRKAIKKLRKSKK